jgi:hypothetical protein
MERHAATIRALAESAAMWPAVGRRSAGSDCVNVVPRDDRSPSRISRCHQNIGVGMSPQSHVGGGVSTAVTGGPEMSTRATTSGSRPYAFRTISRPDARGQACVPA